MSKLSSVLGMGLGMWGLLMGAFIGLNSEGGGLPLKNEVTELNSARDIKTKHKELPCVSELFGNVDWTLKGFQGSMQFLKDGETSGCLAVWWEKETYDSGKWKGSWNLLLGMKDGTSGIAVSSSARANNGKIMAETFSYILKKETDKWSLVSESGMEAKEIKDASSNKKEDLIITPKVGSIDASNGWDFEFDSKNVCSSKNECESETPEQASTHLNWKFVPGTSSPAHEWISSTNNLLTFMITIQPYLSQVKGYFQLV